LTVGRLIRLRALNPIFATDNYVLEELAARFGVSIATILLDREYIQTKWWAREEDERTISERMKQVEFLKMTRRLAIESYHRSRKDEEEITTKFNDVPCDSCNGTGKLPLCKCLDCDGTGRKTEEVVQRKVRGQAGDASFLSEARRCTETICKLMGLNAPERVAIQHVVKGSVEHTIELEEKYRKADPELILQAKAALARLEESKAAVVDGIFKRAEEKENKA
jgi:hypothetical protein